jgi:hypothetical protein
VQGYIKLNELDMPKASLDRASVEQPAAYASVEQPAATALPPSNAAAASWDTFFAEDDQENTQPAKKRLCRVGRGKNMVVNDDEE